MLVVNISVPFSGSSSLVYLPTFVGEHPLPVPADMMLAYSHSMVEEGGVGGGGGGVIWMPC
jgi:hypothetical protein